MLCEHAITEMEYLPEVRLYGVARRHKSRIHSSLEVVDAVAQRPVKTSVNLARRLDPLIRGVLQRNDAITKQVRLHSNAVGKLYLGTHQLALVLRKHFAIIVQPIDNLLATRHRRGHFSNTLTGSVTLIPRCHRIIMRYSDAIVRLGELFVNMIHIHAILSRLAEMPCLESYETSDNRYDDYRATNIHHVFSL
jgi:hypothetical protein